MHIMMMGTGYVGLVTAATLAEMGHSVICLDIDTHKIKQLQNGILPIYEPGLLELVERNTRAGRLLFTTSLVDAVHHASVCFLALPTPSLPSGECNLSYLFQAVESLAQHITRPFLIVNKSTAPVGTVDAIEALFFQKLQERGLDITLDVASNPEFLKEGAAVADAMKPDRIILGIKTEQAAKQLKEIYAPFTINRDRIFIMDTRSAEMTKYAANAMLALRISFMNELSVLCEEMGAHITDVRIGIGSDARIGHQFLYAGVGYGGSCFPKDIRSLAFLAQQKGIPMPILKAIELTNERQKQRLGAKMEAFFAPQGGIAGKTIALWGLSFKPDTDDIREAPSLTLIQHLLDTGAHIRAYDPVSNKKVEAHFKNAQIVFCSDEYDAARGADAIGLITEWKQFRSIDFTRILPLVHQRVFFDGRNQYDAEDMRALGFTYFGIGIPHVEERCEVLCH